jgi:hypothetical protein
VVAKPLKIKNSVPQNILSFILRHSISLIK